MYFETEVGESLDLRLEVGDGADDQVTLESDTIQRYTSSQE